MCRHERISYLRKGTTLSNEIPTKIVGSANWTLVQQSEVSLQGTFYPANAELVVAERKEVSPAEKRRVRMDSIIEESGDCKMFANVSARTAAIPCS